LIHYADTSLLVAALVLEAKTSSVQAWISKEASGKLAVGAWGITEFSAALSIKLRTGQIEPSQQAAALAALAQMMSEMDVSLLSVEQQHFRTAARFADRHELALRAGDALHLAVAAEHGATVCTLDKRMADAGRRIGIPTILL
jgi:predicted nucleic acid-binding protein